MTPVAASPSEPTPLPPTSNSKPKAWNIVARYTHWLHTMWPAGTVEKLPVVQPDGSTNVPGLYVVGDLTGIPLLKFSADTGARAVRTIVAERGTSNQRQGESEDATRAPLDLVIIGAGVSGMAAALEAKKCGLSFVLLEAAEPFSTIVNFPKGKPIFTYPTDMTPAGDLQFRATVKEPLVEELRDQTLGRGIKPIMARVDRVHRGGGGLIVDLAKPADGSPSSFPSLELRTKHVIVAIGRSGNFRKLGVPGEDSGKVFNRLHDPKEWAGKNVLVVGAGDSAVETAIAITQYGGHVTFSFREAELTRPKAENIEKFNVILRDPSAAVEVEKPMSDRVTTAVGGFMERYRTPGSLRSLPLSRVKSIRDAEVVVSTPAGDETFPNDAVFSMIGREAPLQFFRKSGVAIHGERATRWWVTLILSLCIFAFIYHWKKGGVHITAIPSIDHALDIGSFWSSKQLFPYNMPGWWGSLGEAFNRPSNLLGTLKVTVGEPGFYYSFLYCCAIVIFGFRRIARRKTPYVRRQTFSLMAFQLIPLFFLPYLVLPWAGHNGAFDTGAMKWVADQLFPIVGYGHGREYWRAFGIILAWPLFIWNVFTDQPMWLWLGISVVQTCVIIPTLIYFYGKGAYCGWICSCGALAETVGDAHRTKMPHGPFWNRFNMVGQAFLWFAVLLLVFRVLGWSMGHGNWADRSFKYMLKDMPVINYVWFVDLLWAGILGVALYWHFSGRFWCRFACPLAALMHIYARFSRFRIIPEKKKCISCNVCTSVCHQGIDVMNFANKGLPMADPQCVRCSACVQSCPTGVLSFGQISRKTGEVIYKDKLAASAVQIREIGINGKRIAV